MWNVVDDDKNWRWWNREDKFKMKDVNEFWNVKRRIGDKSVLVIQILNGAIEISRQCNDHFLEKWKP